MVKAKKVKIWERVYDNPKNEDGTDKPNKFIGEFEVEEQLMEDMYAEEFIGVKNGKRYLVTGKEVSGFYHPGQGGMRYFISELPTKTPTSKRANKEERRNDK